MHTTESLCKTMARRLKGAGMRWDPAGADALLNLTALQNSNAWENYWKLMPQRNWSHPPHLARLALAPDDRQTRDGHCVAPPRLQALLALKIVEGKRPT
jgi:hypothetical protein